MEYFSDFIPEELIWALERCKSSFVDIFCGDLSKREVAETFDSLFKKRWVDAYNNLVKRITNGKPCENDYFPFSAEDSYPATIEIALDRVIVRCDPILIYYCYGDFCEISEACGAFETALSDLRVLYPEVSYDGLIAFPWSDKRCGDIECYRISSEEKDDSKEVVFKTLGNILNEAVLEGSSSWEWGDITGDDCFLEGVAEELIEGEEISRVEECIKFTRKYQRVLSEEAYNKLIELYDMVKSELEARDFEQR